MKIKMQWVAMLVLVCSVSMLAQTSSSSASTTKDSMSKSDAMGKKMTLTGCISEKDGKYMLMNKKHADGVELMSSEDLKPHVGHKVTVTGMMMGGDAMAAGSSMAMPGMKVASMKMVSEQCSMPDMMMKK